MITAHEAAKATNEIIKQKDINFTHIETSVNDAIKLGNYRMVLMFNIFGIEPNREQQLSYKHFLESHGYKVELMHDPLAQDVNKYYIGLDISWS